MSVAIRPAVEDDAPAIARVQVATWRSAYAGIFPAPYLEGLNDVRIALGWVDAIAERGAVTLVAEDAGLAREPVVGFLHAGPSAEAGWSEVFTLYVVAAQQGRGIGRALLAALAAVLRRRRAQGVVIRVLVENAPARRFYARLGGAEAETRTLRVGGRAVDEIAYRWPSAAALAAGLGVPQADTAPADKTDDTQTGDTMTGDTMTGDTRMGDTQRGGER